VDFIKRKPIIISILIFLSIVIGFSAVYFNNKIKATNELPVQTVKRGEINQVNIGKYISSNHEYWNNALCWGRSKNFSFIVFEKNYNEYIKELDQIIDATENPHLKSDFTHVEKLLKKAEETKDIGSLIDVHRIFHDLDVTVNGYETSDFFGITEYGGDRNG